MTTLREAVMAGLNLEREHNGRMRLVGYHGALLPIPAFRYRLLRAAHLGQIAVRENIALAIAPWLDPDDTEIRCR